MLTESPDNAVRKAGRRVLAMEADALLSLADSLDSAFDEAVDILAAATGRVIVTGMGKSGHVAVKIASTLASTGTPAHFVHPGEAAHGDQDALLWAQDLDDALSALARFDEGPDLVLYFKRLMVLEGNPEYAHALDPEDELSPSQRAYVEAHWERFRRWWDQWRGARG